MRFTKPQLWTRLRGSSPDVYQALEEIVRALMLTFPGLSDSHKGTYSAGREYQIDDLVSLDGSTYVCIAVARGKDPATSPRYWTELASAGSAGASGSSATTASQTVISGAVDSTTGCANFLSAGTGLAVDLAATSVAVAIAFAAGYDASGQVSYVGRVTADASDAWSGLTASTTNYLYVDRNSGTGALTYGQTLYYPVYQSFEPSWHHRPVSLLATAYVSGGDGSGAVANAFDGNHNTNFGSTQTGASVSGAAYLGVDFGAGNSYEVTGFTLANNGGATNNIASVLVEYSSDGAAWTTIQTSALSTTADAIQQITVASYGGARYFRLLANANPGGAVPWRVNELSLWHKPSGLHWFNTATRQMSYWDGAAWNTVQRVFVGEAVTDATSVTSTITYALNGMYDSGWFSVSPSSSQYDKVHALGLMMDEGVVADVYFSRLGASHDSRKLTGPSYAAATRSGFTWNHLNSLTTLGNTRTSAYLQIDNGLVTAFGISGMAHGFYRLTMRRTW